MGMLDGKVVLVTHATAFIGGPSVEACMAEGAIVIAQDPSFVDLNAREAFEASYQGAILLALEDPHALVKAVMSGQGRLDGLVANDGFPAIRAKVEDANPQDMRDGLEAMVVAPFRLIGAAVTQMKAQGKGRIVMTTSAAPYRGLPNYSMYVTARGAQNTMVQTLARELAQTGITMNAVAPNFVESPTYFPEALLNNEAAMTKILAQIPMGRMGKPREAADIVAFLLSDRAGFTTGHAIPVAGGWA